MDIHGKTKGVYPICGLAKRVLVPDDGEVYMF